MNVLIVNREIKLGVAASIAVQQVKNKMREYHHHKRV